MPLTMHEVGDLSVLRRTTHGQTQDITGADGGTDQSQKHLSIFPQKPAQDYLQTLTLSTLSGVIFLVIFFGKLFLTSRIVVMYPTKL